MANILLHSLTREREVRKLKTHGLKLFSTQQEYDEGRRKLAILAFRYGIIEPRMKEEEGAVFKVMNEEGLTFVRRVPVYTNNRIAQSLLEVRELELQLLTWLVETRLTQYDRIAPVPDEANWLSFGVSERTGLPHVQPRRPKGYGVSDDDPMDGVFSAGDRFVTIEGTSTTFGSIAQNVQRFQLKKCPVIRAHAVFTYVWGLVQTLTDLGCYFEPVLTVRAAFGIALTEPKETKLTQGVHDFVTNYLEHAEEFYRGDHSYERAKALGLLKTGA